MCDTCGCNQPQSAVTVQMAGQPAPPVNSIWQAQPVYPSTAHTHDHGREIELEQDILSKNNHLAQANRTFFTTHGILTLNLVSSPGSGKTTILERTILELKTDFPLAIIEGDQQTMHDADRILRAGAPAVQVNTGNGCHLDASMIQRAIETIQPKDHSLLFIENVGNLVCPALFDLGEAHKIVIISVTEGDDKPLKYPTMFSVSDICIINKTDLLPYVNFDVKRCKDFALQVNPNLHFFELSATRKTGMNHWLDWLKTELKTL